MSTAANVCDHVFSALVVVLAVVYLCFQGINKRWNAVLAFVVLFVLLMMMHVFGASVTLFLDWRVCLLLALVGSSIVALPQSVYSSEAGIHSAVTHEGFANAATSAKRSRRSRASRGRAATVETMANPSVAPTKPAAGGSAKREYVDTFSTFMNTYKNLNPNQIEKMNTDTKELINTQKALMDTVKSFAPVLKEGREMMSTFKEYFGEGAEATLKDAVRGKHDAMENAE